MRTGMRLRGRFGRLGMVVLAGAVASAALPAGAGAAQVIVPHAAQAQQVQTHVVDPPPRSAPTRSPAPVASDTDSAPYGGEANLPGADVPSAENDPPFPEGLPPHWDPDCDLACLQEWHGYFFNRFITVRASGQQQAAKQLKEEDQQVKDAIDDEGATPGEEPEDEPTRPSSGDAPPPAATQSGAASRSQGIAPVQRSEPPESIPDAITGVGAIVGGVLSEGTGSNTPASDDLGSNPVVDAITFGPLLRSLFSNPCPHGGAMSADNRIEDTNGGSNGCF